MAHNKTHCVIMETEEDRLEREQFHLFLRTQFDRVALAIQFLEKTAPTQENRSIMERFIVRTIIHDTDLNKTENEE